MQPATMSRALPFVAVAVTICLASVQAGDWPRFRGPEGDGISDETGLLERWPDGGPELLWRVELGEGFSGLSLVEGRIYTMYSRGKDEYAACLDAASGKEIWKARVDDAWQDRHGNGPRSTPTVDGQTVYVLSSNAKLFALNARSGSVLWKTDLVKDHGGRVPRWGMSGSPVVDGKLVLAEVGASDALMAAFNAETGKLVWKSEGGKAGYSTPLVATIGGTSQVVFFTGEEIYSASIADGSVLWKIPWKTSWDVNAAMPIFLPPDRLFISSGYDTGAAMLQVKGSGGSFKVDEVWRNRDMKNQFSTSVLHDGYLYGFDNKILKCLDAASGEMKWRARDLGHGSLMYADGRLIVLGERGQLVLVEATPEAYREKGRTQVFETKTWTVPTLSNGKLYIRDQSELLALDVKS